MKDYRIVQLSHLPIYRIEYRKEHWLLPSVFDRWAPLKEFDGWEGFDVREYSSLERALARVRIHQARNLEQLARSANLWRRVWP